MYFLQLLWQDILRWGRRLVFAAGLITLSIPVAVLAFRYVPLYPHSPRCSIGFLDPNERKRASSPYKSSQWVNDLEISGTMSDIYADRFAEYMSYYGVPFVRIGNHIFLTFYVVAWGDPDDRVSNANGKILLTLSKSEYNPTWKDMPDDVRRMVTAKLRKNPFAAYDDCDVARALPIENWGR